RYRDYLGPVVTARQEKRWLLHASGRITHGRRRFSMVQTAPNGMNSVLRPGAYSLKRSLLAGVGSHILVRELSFDLVGRVDLAVYLNVGINEEVQLVAVLLWHQVDVASGGEGDTILGQVAEIILAQLRVLVRLGDVHRNPAHPL